MDECIIGIIKEVYQGLLLFKKCIGLKGNLDFRKTIGLNFSARRGILLGSAGAWVQILIIIKKLKKKSLVWPTLWKIQNVCLQIDSPCNDNIWNSAKLSKPTRLDWLHIYGMINFTSLFSFFFFKEGVDYM